MKTHVSAVLLASALAAACTSTVYDPLEDYEQLNPATTLEAPPARPGEAFTEEQVARGRYMVGLLGCGSCHTDGALIGQPDQTRLLAGSGIGIAYSNPLAMRHPGVVYPANITPDMETGIGEWSTAQIVAMLRTGMDNHSSQSLPVMPWPAYARIDDTDAQAIAAYLKSLAPVRHAVPANVSPGRPARAPFVHFGVYRGKE